MEIDYLINYARIIGPILTAISIFLGIYYFSLNVRRDKAKQTLDYWEKINQQLKEEKKTLTKDYGKYIDEEMALLLVEDKEERPRISKFLNIYERLSLGVNMGLYDVKVLNKLAGQVIIDNFYKYENFINARRIQVNRDFLFVEYEKLVLHLKNNRKKLNE
ncbi:MAG: DUF4760 domain-containing protein [Desulforhopalus sp.]|nr:DUF4760 domain-containing protein [Desulforhopalus sp.]